MKVKDANKEKFLGQLYNLVRAIKAESDRCSEFCGGLSEKEMTVLGFVGQQKSVKMTDIAENIDAPMSTLTNIVDKLVERKILAREHSSDDRRAINVTLGSSGKPMYKALVEQKIIVAEKILSQLNEKDQALFLEHMNALIAGLGKK